jgi:protein-S-isoprenylcysteine O-methyltransferase Ste14
MTMWSIQHSVMARPRFKRWITRTIRKPAGRSTYTLAVSLLLIALFTFWEPIGGAVWRVEDPAGKAVLYSLFGFGWGLVLVSTCLINHFDLFGLRQVWRYLTGTLYTHLKFATPGPYKWVRHPLYVGWFFAF